MTDSLFDQTPEDHNPTETPGAAVQNSGVSLTVAKSQESDLKKEEGASRGVPQGAAGRDAADHESKPHNQVYAHPWAPPGDAVLTTSETRVYLYDKYDMLFPARRLQKFRLEDNPELLHRKLIGETEPKREGGQQLLFAQSSIDEFASHALNQHYRNAHQIPLDPSDLDFEALQKAALTKPYDVVIQRDANVTPIAKSETPETPTDTPRGAEGHDDHVPPDKIAKPSRDADLEQAETPRGAVPREQHDFLKKQFDEYQEMFKQEKRDRETAQAKRENERTSFEQQREQLQTQHQREKQELLEDLEEMTEAAFNLKMKATLMSAAYNEAAGLLPEEAKAKLTIDINQTDKFELPSKTQHN